MKDCLPLFLLLAMILGFAALASAQRTTTTLISTDGFGNTLVVRTVSTPTRTPDYSAQAIQEIRPINEADQLFNSGTMCKELKAQRERDAKALRQLVSKDD
jgi:hypothetical protein